MFRVSMIGVIFFVFNSNCFIAILNQLYLKVKSYLIIDILLLNKNNYNKKCSHFGCICYQYCSLYKNLILFPIFLYTRKPPLINPVYIGDVCSKFFCYFHDVAHTIRYVFGKISAFKIWHIALRII